MYERFSNPYRKDILQPPETGRFVGTVKPSLNTIFSPQQTPYRHIEISEAKNLINNYVPPRPVHKNSTIEKILNESIPSFSTNTQNSLVSDKPPTWAGKTTPTGDMTSTAETLYRAGYAGAIGTVGSMLLFGDSFNQSVNLLGMQVSAPIAVGLTTAAASVGTDIAKSYILPMTGQSAQAQNIESAAIGAASSGALTAISLRGFGAAPNTMGQAAAFGAATYVGADWATNKTVSNGTFSLY